MKTFCGLYKHYKGENYEVFCLAKDMQDSYGESFVLYRQLYGDKSFWIRPQKMFFEKVHFNGLQVQRFSLEGEAQDTSDKIKEFVTIVKRSRTPIRIRHSETLCEYTVFSIDYDSQDEVLLVSFAPKLFSGSPYLTDKELAYRLGYACFLLNGKYEIKKVKLPFDGKYELKVISKNYSTDELLKTQFNPCSIDLHIAREGFLVSTRRMMDVWSVEHISNSKKYWKPIRTKTNSEGIKEFILKPGKTVLTKTDEIIYIPEDCAGKIEIKSTYARLSLSVTTGDFCNPGYHGQYPLVIRNDGNTALKLHSCEVMAQLMLIGLKSPVLNPYELSATFLNRDGLDDGSPFSFFRERSLRAIKKRIGLEKVEEIFNGVLKQVDESSMEKKSQIRERFEATFCAFCSKCQNQKQYKEFTEDKPDIRKICKAYRKREAFLKRVLTWGPGSLGAFIAVAGILVDIIKKSDTPSNMAWTIVIIALVAVLISYIVIYFIKPEAFCDEIDFLNLKDESGKPIL